MAEGARGWGRRDRAAPWPAAGRAAWRSAPRHVRGVAGSPIAGLPLAGGPASATARQRPQDVGSRRAGGRLVGDVPTSAWWPSPSTTARATVDSDGAGHPGPAPGAGHLLPGRGAGPPARRVVRDRLAGHEVGNHSWAAPGPGRDWTPPRSYDDLRRSHDAITEVTGVPPAAAPPAVRAPGRGGAARRGPAGLPAGALVVADGGARVSRTTRPVTPDGSWPTSAGHDLLGHDVGGEPAAGRAAGPDRHDQRAAGPRLHLRHGLRSCWPSGRGRDVGPVGSRSVSSTLSVLSATGTSATSSSPSWWSSAPTGSSWCRCWCCCRT